MLDLSKFSEKRKGSTQISYRIKYYLLRRLLGRSPIFFMNPSDIITRFTLAYSVHEKMVYELIKFIAEHDHNEFFIDIGANIGLTSAQTRGTYKKYILIEPNPLLKNVLEVNAEMHLPQGSHEIFNVGLADIDDRRELIIPRDNWGGAFIKEGNAYDLKTLLGKDGKEDITEEFYITKKVMLKNSQDFMLKIIKKLKTDGIRKGFIKIDVEGYEMVILQTLLPILEKENMSCFIMFEQWDKNWSRTILDKLIERPLQIWLLEENDPDFRTRHGIFSIFKALLKGNLIENRLKPVEARPAVGNLLIYV